jgi:ankyrin repeat protein
MKSTALHWACYTGSTTVASLLLAKGADPNQVDASGMTPLHHAIDSAYEKVGDCSLVRWLLIYGANPLISDNRGKSVFNTAKSLPESEIKKELLKILKTFSKSGAACKYFNTEP